MPYIKPADRSVYDFMLRIIESDFASVGAGGGDLNYVLTKVCIAWLNYHQPPHNYELLSTVFKELGCAQAEWYRRVLAPYEDKKREENGDVY